jgi:hypothetical protein
VAEALDKERGSSVTDGSIFRAHAAKYEVSMSRGVVRSSNICSLRMQARMAWLQRL